MNRRRLFDLIATLGTIAIIVLGVEGAVRLVADDGMQYDLEMWKYARDVKRISADPLIGHEHAPGRAATLMGVDFRTNSKGLRDRELPYAKTPGRLRVLMLGDLLTVGWGVAVEDTFSKRVERMYAQSGIDAEVINAGVGNYNTIQEVKYFLTEGQKYNPDIVVLNYFVNDAEPNPSHAPPSILTRNCYACVFVAGRVDTLARMASGRRDWADYYLSLYDGGRAKGWLDAKAQIGKLVDYCRTNRIRLIVASLPELHELAPYRFQPVTDLVQVAARDYGAEFVDVLPFLKDKRPSDLWVTPPDPHPNALAHSLIAAGLFDALRKTREAQ